MPLFWNEPVAISDSGTAPAGLLTFMITVTYLIPVCGHLMHIGKCRSNMAFKIRGDGSESWIKEQRNNEWTTDYHRYLMGDDVPSSLTRLLALMFSVHLPWKASLAPISWNLKVSPWPRGCGFARHRNELCPSTGASEWSHSLYSTV